MPRAWAIDSRWPCLSTRFLSEANLGNHLGTTTTTSENFSMSRHCNQCGAPIRPPDAEECYKCRAELAIRAGTLDDAERALEHSLRIRAPRSEETLIPAKEIQNSFLADRFKLWSPDPAEVRRAVITRPRWSTFDDLRT
jgi:hypothetical protein